MKRPPKTDYAPIVSRRQQREWLAVAVLGVGVPLVLLTAVVLFLRWAGGQG